MGLSNSGLIQLFSIRLNITTRSLARIKARVQYEGNNNDDISNWILLLKPYLSHLCFALSFNFFSSKRANLYGFFSSISFCLIDKVIFFLITISRGHFWDMALSQVILLLGELHFTYIFRTQL